VDNLVHAIYLAATKAGADREVFLVGDQEQVTWADLYQPVAEALGYDLAGVPEGELSERKLPWLDRLEPIRVSKPVQGFLSIFPHKLRLAAYLAYQTILEPQTDSSTALANQPRLAATLEMAMLYSCSYKLPHEKATQFLGYQPPVSFQEACRRTVAWLAFAGYPVVGKKVRVHEFDKTSDG
jgi:nucleoside-diphosphate-sugar epimerase